MPRQPGLLIDATGKVQHNEALRLHERISMHVFPAVFDAATGLAALGMLVLATLVNLVLPARRRASAAAIIASATVCLMLIGAALVVALVELGLQRYAAPTRFTYFL